MNIPKIPTQPPGASPSKLPPRDAGSLPDHLLNDVFKKLNPNIPLLFLPVRLETRFNLDLDPPVLQIRVYPDQIQIDSDRPQASVTEQDLTRKFWQDWYASQAEPARQAAWQNYVRTIGSPRAGYLARLLRPVQDSLGTLTFPTLPPDTGALRPAYPALLPERWLALGYGAGGVQIFRRAGLPIDRNLRTAPQVDAPTVTIAGGELAVDDGLAWMFDYPRALQCGMAIDVPLTGDAAQALDQVSTLLVLGLVTDRTPLQASSELARLLNVHARSTGLAFVPQGTPTNNTESASSGWKAQETGFDAMFDREVGDLPAPGKYDNAARLAWALGMSSPQDFQRLVNGADPEARRSQQMRSVLFESVLGTLLRQLLDVGGAPGLSAAVINTIRSWFITYVTGGAPIPTLRVGDQPYGILPVRKSVSAPSLTTQAGQVEHIINMLKDTWRLSAEQLSPLTGAGGAGSAQEDEAETAISVFLAAQPHPARLFIRQFEEYIAGETAPAIQITYDFILTTLNNSITGPYMEGITEVAYTYQDLLESLYPAGFTSIDDQIDLWDQLKYKVSQTFTGGVLEKGSVYCDFVLGNLNRYAERQQPLRQLDLLRFEGVLGEENTRLVAGLLYGSSTEWGGAGLVQSPSASPENTAGVYLRDFRQRFKNRTASGSLPLASSVPSPKPLLYQLLDLTLAQVPNKPALNREVLGALSGLAALDADQLEWLLRETLGLGAHRLDAWAASLAVERLEQLRKKTPLGIQIGAFGWTVGLSPRRSPRASRGFVHAPSMPQAATAAVLRAGWQADGGDDPLSPLAVNIDSKRVRTAAWLLDGVRQGQPLGSLLGYRFERLLHDLHADDQIWTVRQSVLTAQKRPRQMAEQPVDGIDLLDLYRAGKLGRLSEPVRQALTDLEASFDAVQDVGLFESVHQALSGSYDRAAAMLDALSTGAVPPPELRAPVTQRSALSVEHRVVILLPANPPVPASGWQTGIRDRLSPALEGWVSSLLPPPASVGFQVQVTSPEGQIIFSGGQTLADLGISALDAVYLAGSDPQTAAPSIRTLAGLAAHASGSVMVDPAQSIQPVSLADFTLLAAELRNLLETLRPLDGRDLRPADQRGEPGVDLAAVNAAAGAFLQEISPRFNDLSNADSTRQVRAVRWFARAGIATGLTLLDAQSISTLQALASQRMESLPADLTAALADLEAVLAGIFHQRIPLLGQFNLDSPALSESLPAAGGEESDAWLDAVSRVQPGVGKLFTMGMLSELLGAPGLSLWAGQYPREAGEGWAAIVRPLGSGRLSLLAVCPPGSPPQPQQAVCGLLVEQWNEAVPSGEQVTGVAFHYDAPSNRPPQSWLLAVTPDQEPWSLKLAADTLLETLEWAVLRAVGPEDLLDFGRSIPTAFLPGSLSRWIEETKT